MTLSPLKAAEVYLAGGGGVNSMNCPSYSPVFCPILRRTDFLIIHFTYLVHTNPHLVQFPNSMIPWEHKIHTKAKLFQEAKFFVNRLVPAEHFRPVWTCIIVTLGE